MFRTESRRRFFYPVLLFAAGCTFQVQSCVPSRSNIPDSGIDCQADAAGNGSASFSGPAAFAVHTVTEQVEGYYGADGGAFAAADMWIRFTGSNIAACAVDNGPGPVLFCRLNDPAQAYASGTYAIVSPDGGGRQATALLNSPDAGIRSATGGSVQLTAVAACSIQGTVSLFFGSPTTGPADLQGSFTADYCP